MPTKSNTGSAQRLDADRGIGMMGSEASLRKILTTVASSLAADLPKVDAALQSGDVASANRLLHAFKGYMPIMACDALVAQVTQVEQLS